MQTGKRNINRIEILQILKEYQKNNGEKFGVVELGVFGSAAKESMCEHSDLDIVVRLREQDLFSLIGIKQDLEEYFHTKVDVVSYRPRMNPILKKRIDQEAVYV